MCLGTGRCRMTPSTSGIVVHRDDPRLALVLGERARPALLLEAEADLPGGVRLAAHVDGGLLLLADADRDEAADLMCGRSRAHALRDVVENAVADGAAVQEPIVDHRVRGGRSSDRNVMAICQEVNRDT